MKTYSFSGPRVFDLYRGQFKKDLFKLLVSMTFRPTDWKVWKIYNKIYSIENKKEDMEVWLANGAWAINFKCNGTRYGGVVLHAISPWRFKVYKEAMKLAKSQWIKEA